ncbi:helix-turn-helix domain-containing protein [Rhizobium hidalgonense]|uniref:helix-turn-helix domain-containing protein n=1 Tax=Rhizobium hidalgonense TaxID=1538159 RepID=UPI002870E8C4|nr:helix-turn-helix domain-containing protein [Rhizobium hidalgonense]MDR9811903.1 hypothetical protein [Rhizobium hidalgonense]
MKTPAKKTKRPVTHPTGYRTIAALPGYLFGDNGCIVSTRLLKDTDVIPSSTEGSFRIRTGNKKDAPRIERIKRTVYQGHLSANLRITRADGQRVYKSFRVAALMCTAWHGERPAPSARAEIIDAAASVTPANVQWNTPDLSAGPVKRRSRAATTARNAELIALHKQGLRDAEIAKRTGIPPSTVSRSIAPHRQIIRPRDVGSRLDLAHVLRLFAQGTLQADIARTLSVTRGVINRLIAKSRATGSLKDGLAESLPA